MDSRVEECIYLNIDFWCADIFVPVINSIHFVHRRFCHKGGDTMIDSREFRSGRCSLDVGVESG